ncbi:MAG TPA: DUF445 domain-containing protein, partial [Clostridiales bacterium]|nr:DUF445 domain-containing protein [Clostridiales bacterium]
MFLHVLKIISGPIIGAIIGYVTNYIAVKMLFRPYKQKRIGKLKIPFTPGIIPKRQPQIAKAVGKAVGENLFTEEDIKKSFSVMEFNVKSLLKDYTFLDVLSKFDKDGTLCEKGVDYVTDKLYEELKSADLGTIIAEQGEKVFLKKKASLGMMAMFIGDKLISNVADELKSKTNEYIEENGREIIKAKVKDKFEKLKGENLSEICNNKLIEGLLNDFISKFLLNFIQKGVEKIDVSKVVEDKVNAMDVKELEKLCLSVMKKELNAVVDLGALIGFVLG